MSSSKSILYLLFNVMILVFVGCGMPQDRTNEGGSLSPQNTPITPEIIATYIPTESGTEALPAVQEARMLTLEWPQKIRTGDSDVIRLTLEIDDLGNLTPTAEISGHEVRGEVIYIPDIYETHNVIAAARLDISGLQIVPNNLIEQPLLPGESLDYYWSVTTDQIGTFRGTVWLYLRFLPLDGGEETHKPLTAQVIEIQSVNLMGLGGTPARLLGTMGMVICGLLGMDDLLSLLKRGYQLIKKGA